MTKREQNVEAGRKFGEAVNAAGIVERFFGYIFSYIIILIVGVLFINSSKILAPLGGKVNEELVVLIILFLFALPFYFWERGIRRFRRANGLSIYKNIKAELEQMEFNKMYEKEREMEERAKAAYELKKKKDGLQD